MSNFGDPFLSLYLWATLISPKPLRQKTLRYYYYYLFILQSRGAQLKSLGGPKKLFDLTQSQNDMILTIQRVYLLRKQSKSTKFRVQRAKLKAFAGHIWPAGRMLCMPALECNREIRVFELIFELSELTLLAHIQGERLRWGSVCCLARVRF